MSETEVLPETGRHLVEAAEAAGVHIRLIGGAAIWLRAEGPARAALGRQYPDLDFVALGKQSRVLRSTLEAVGLVPDQRFNAVHGAQRLIFNDAGGSFHIDIFLDSFVMSHTLNLTRRIELETPTLPAAELLLSKLQIAQLNRKDVSDTILLLASHELGSSDGPGSLNATYVAEVTSREWGLFTSLSDNLGKVSELVGDILAEARYPAWSNTAVQAEVLERIGLLRDAMEVAPKSVAWRARAAVGRRVRWYAEPEEVDR